MPQRERVFICYSHEDAVWLKRVREQLSVLEREGLIDIFDDTLISGGEGWYARLDQEMLRAKLAVLLVSQPFITSDFIQREEIPRLFDKHSEVGMMIYPILVRACSWRRVKWLADLQLRPPGARPISKLRPAARDQVLADIVDEIALLVGLPARADSSKVNDIRVPEPVSNKDEFSDVEKPIGLDSIVNEGNGGRISLDPEQRPPVKTEHDMETVFINSFPDYCDHCAKMMKRATGEEHRIGVRLAIVRFPSALSNQKFLFADPAAP